MEQHEVEERLLELESLMDKYMNISEIVYQKLNEHVAEFMSLLQDEFDNHEKAETIVDYSKLEKMYATTTKYFLKMGKVPDRFAELFHRVRNCFYFRQSHQYGRGVTETKAPKETKPKQDLAAAILNLTPEQKEAFKKALLGNKTVE